MITYLYRSLIALSLYLAGHASAELDLKGAMGVYELMDKSISLEDPRERIMHLHHRLKILDRDAIDRLGDIKIPYNGHYQEARLVRAETITPDGRKVAIQKELVRDVVPENAQGFAEYSDTRILSFSMPALSKGAVIDYEIEVRFKPVMEDLFSMAHYFDHALPVQTSRLVITTPVELDLTLMAQRFDEAAAAVTNEAMVTRTWELQDIPGIKAEANLPPVADIRHSLRVTSLDSWDPVAKWFGGLMVGRISDDAEVKALAERLTAGIEDPIEQINALLLYVQTDVRYVAVELGQGAYQPRPAKACLRNLYGDCKDQSVVLISLLRAAGFDAQIALLRVNFFGKVYKEIPEPGQFNHAIVYLRHEGRDLWMDPTIPYIDAEAWPEGLDGVEALVIDGTEGRFVSIPALDPRKCLNERKYTIEISPDGLHRVVFSEYASGRRASHLRKVMSEIGPDRMEDEMMRNASGRPGFQRMLGYQVDSLERLTPSFRYQIEFVSNQMLTPGRDSFAITLEAGQTAGMLVLQDWSRGREEREKDWVNLSTRADSLSLEFVLPPGYKLSNAVKAYEKKLPHGTLSMNADFKGRRLIAGVSAVLKPARIRASRFDDVRRDVERLLQRADQPLEFVDEPAQLMVNRQLHEARDYLGELMERFPEDAFLCMRLGDNFAACGYRMKAEQLYQTAIEMDPTVFAFYERLANLQHIYSAELGGAYHRAEAIEILERSRKHLADTKFLDASISIALSTDANRHLFGPGTEVDRAMKLVDELVEAYPDDPNILNWRGVSHYHQGSYEDAADLLTQALKKGSRLVETQQVLWRSEVLTGAIEPGLNRLVSVVKQQNQVMSEMMFLMQKLASAGQFEDANFMAQQIAARAGRPEIVEDLMKEILPLRGRVIPAYSDLMDQGNPAAAARSFISAFHYGDRARLEALIAPVCDLACSEILAMGHAMAAASANQELRDMNLAMLFNELNARSTELAEDLVRYQVRREASTIRSASVSMSLLLLREEGKWWVIDFDNPGGRNPNLLAGYLEKVWKSGNADRSRLLTDYIGTYYGQTDSILRALEYRPLLNQPLDDEMDQAQALLAGALVYSGNQQKVDRGLGYLEQLIERYPDSAVLHSSLGRVYSAETLPNKAVVAKSRVLEIQGVRENLLADQVQAYLQAGQVSNAWEGITELELEYPASRFRDDLRVEYHLRANELDEALRRIVAQSEEKQAKPMTMLDLFVYLGSGETNHLARISERMRMGQPILQTYQQLGMGYLALSDLDRAREQFEIMLLLEPGHINARLELARTLLIQGDEGEAERLISDYVNSQHCSDEWASRLCYVRHGQQKYKEAIEAYAIASANRPAMAGDYFRLLTAMCYQEMGEEDQAQEWLEKIADWEAPEPAMTTHFARMLLGREKPQTVEARIRMMDDYILRKDHLTEYYFYRGMQALSAGKEDAARVAFEQALAELRPHHMEYFLARMHLVRLKQK